MNAKKENATIIGVAVAACAACCAGPILAAVTAIGLGTIAGFAVFGTIAVVIGAAAAVFMIVRRKRRVAACVATETSPPVPVELVRPRR